MMKTEMMCEINNQLDFLNFLTDCDLLNSLTDEHVQTQNIRHAPSSYNNNLPIKLSTKKILNVQFYKKIFGISEGLNVALIMLGKHKQYNIPIYENEGNSGVGVNSQKCVIEGEIHSTPTIQGFETMAHETGHARSGKTLKYISLLNNINSASTAQEKKDAEQQLEGFLHEKSQCSYDCIGEIDTITIEKLFLNFLAHNSKSKRVLNNYNFDINAYKQEYANEHENMIYNHIAHIVNTKELFEKYGITQPFKSEAEFDIFLNSMPDNKARQEFANNMESILEKPNQNTAGRGAKYRFRYILGEAVSHYWFNALMQTNDKKERNKLMEQFVKFWKGSDKFKNHQQACLMLCDGKSIKDVVVAYLEQSQIHNTTQNANVTP